jgi:hypothetical protein
MAELGRGRGRPATGRKVIAQAGLDQKDFELVTRIASKEHKSVSEALRELIMEGLSARSRRR